MPYDAGGRGSGLMVSKLISGWSGPGSSPGRGQCVETLYFHSGCLRSMKMGTGELTNDVPASHAGVVASCY